MDTYQSVNAMPSGPLDDVFEQLSEMMEFLDEKGENLAEGKLPPGLRERIDTLKGFMEQYNDVTDAALRDAGVDPKQLQGENLAAGMGKREEALLHRFENLKKDLIQRKQMLEAAIERTQAGDDNELTPDAQAATGKEGRKKKRARKKKFRGLGDDKWMKM